MPQDLSQTLTIAVDVLDSLRAHLALAALALALLLALLRRRRGALLSGLGAALLAAGLGPVWTFPAARAVGPEAPDAVEITLVSANILRTNPRIEAARDALLALSPDILVLVETPPALEAVAAAALGDERLDFALPGARGHTGITVLTPRPYRRAPPLVFHDWISWHVAVDVPLDDRGRSLRLIALHNPAPFTRSHARRRAGLPQFAPVVADPMVVVGDFNAAPWTRTVAATGAATGTAVAGGWRPTWFPRLGGLGDLLRPWIGLPIDHLLTSPAVEVLSIRAVPVPGSDHRAVAARLRVTWPSSPRPPSAPIP